MTFDASDFTGTQQQTYVGFGNHVLTGGAASDVFNVNGGSAAIVGGAGEDFLSLGAYLVSDAPLVVTRSGGVTSLQSSDQTVTASDVEGLYIYATTASYGLYVDASQYDLPIEFSASASA